MSANCDVIAIFMFNLEQFKGLIPDVRFVKLAVSLKINFYLIKTENRTQN